MTPPTNHSPLPWRAILDNKKKTKWGAPPAMSLVRTGSGHTCIDCTGSGDSKEQSDANAKFICQAVNTHAAALDCVELLRMTLGYFTEESLHFKRLNAALAKWEEANKSNLK